MEDKSEQDKIKNKQEEKALNQNRKEIEQDKAPSENNKLEQDIIPSVLKQQANWDALFFYQKSDVIYQLTFAFCDRFIHLYKDRTRDQVIQAARSCKQNIVEGLADGVTSTEMQLKLLNVARASLKETREDFEDYLKSRHLLFYRKGEDRYDKMLSYCRYHNKLEDYEPFFSKWSDEEMCNCAITLCHMVDKMLMSFLAKLDREFVTEGGIKERMYKARTGYRQKQDERLKQLEEENPRLIKQILDLKGQLEEQKEEQKRLMEEQKAQLEDALSLAAKWQAAYKDLKKRALKAYYEQQAEIERLKKDR
ncbi:MAG: four helix bundle suffix domain-containing protein [Prevotella sp.]|nr:four helix bundle suffix domain-containing protein [Prevotella sp.]MDY4151093.1 four helix bundle suffix domain-containing protein [Prevotella sp.]